MARSINTQAVTEIPVVPEVETPAKEIQVISENMVIINLLQENNALLSEILTTLKPLTTETPKPEQG